MIYDSSISALALYDLFLYTGIVTCVYSPTLGVSYLSFDALLYLIHLHSLFIVWYIAICGGQVTMLKPPSFGDCPSNSEIKQALETAEQSGMPYKMITLTHVDTSSRFVSG
jgi:hypothetical protein